MFDFKMIERVYEHCQEISWAEREAMIQHCLWSEDAATLLAWLNDSSDGELVLRVAGVEQTPVVLDVDPEGPIQISEGQSVHKALGLSDESIEYAWAITKPDAIRIVKDKPAVSQERMRAAFEVYADFVKARIQGEPFVYLKIQTRSLPLRVAFVKESE